MPSVSFPKEWCLRTALAFGVATNDCALICFSRRFDGLAIFGGQTGLVAADATLWVDSRAFSPHLDKGFEGAVSPPDPEAPPRVIAVATNVRVLEETGASLPDERAIVPANATLHIRWDAPVLSFGASDEDEQGTQQSGGGWAWRLLDCATGIRVASGTATTPLSLATPLSPPVWEAIVPASLLGSAGRCLLFWVGAAGVEKSYVWPTDYASVTGASEARPKAYAWTHPTRGPFHFDPKYRVGARPYDRADPVQAALLDATEQFELDGELILRPEWADKLLVFNADGSITTNEGDLSCVKIQSASTWLGDQAVHWGASAGPSLWRDSGSSPSSESGVLSPLQIEPRLRSVRAILRGSGNTLWLAGATSTRSGRRTSLLRVDASWNVVERYTHDPFSGTGAPSKEQSRALFCAVDGRSLAIYRGRLRLTTLAGQLELRGDRLVRIGVGGRSYHVLERMDGLQLDAHVTDPDLASSSAFARFGTPTGGGHVVASHSLYPGPLLAKVVDNALAPGNEAFYGLVCNTGKEEKKRPAEEVEKEPLDDQQGLARWTTGGLEQVLWWRASRTDMSRVIPWPGGVYAFGFNDKLQPRAHRLTLAGDGLWETGLQVPYIVLGGECGLSSDGQSECLRVVGRKMFGRRALPGTYAAEGTVGSRGAGGVSLGSGPPQTDFAWDGTKFSLSRAACLASGFALDAFPPFLRWSEEGLCWLATASQPVNGAGQPLVPYLVFNGSGDPLTWTPGTGVILPQSVAKWGGLRFTSGTCQGVVGRKLVPDPTCGPLDVAFVLDTTGSMGGALQNVKTELASLIGDIKTSSGNNYRISLVTFKDVVEVVVPFASGNADAVTSQLLLLQPAGGNNEPESSDEAVKTAVLARQANQLTGALAGKQIGNFAPWRPGATKIVILVTDARPGSFDDDYQDGVHDARALAVANTAKTLGIRLSAILVPRSSYQETITGIMDAYASVTGGLFARTRGGGEGVAEAMRDVITSCGGSVVESFVEYCTEDVVTPVSSCGSARCVAENNPGAKVGVFRIETPGPMHAVWLDERSNPALFAAMCKSEQRIWVRLDGTTPIALSSGGALSSNDLQALGEFNVPLRANREEWLPKSAHRVEVAVILDAGVGLEVTLTPVH